jgi:pyruvate/2-oxoacid:ferredoxin oxidoreductase beta subunit/Pyruvate/2-oxoacid:ferredoxin oxidoreductase gamma subunit
MVSDIGCSGLFDTFFSTHAFHGLHGRALTYATGIKLARPQLRVVVTMGDGGLGIGGAHFIEACRRNLDLTLLVLNNFNFGMTGGQFSCTTPADASVASGFLNSLEKPMDICRVAAAAGAPFTARCSVYQNDLPRILIEAIDFDGFSVVDIWGPCTGYFSRRNRLSPRQIEQEMKEHPSFNGPVAANMRREYGRSYREACGATRDAALEWKKIEAVFSPPVKERREIVILGAAGDRIISTGLILAHAAVLGGMQVTQKNDYDITVMRGPSVTELILSPNPILYTGVEQPDVIVALAPEGIMRKRDLFGRMSSMGRVILEKGLEVPDTTARVIEIDFKAQGIKRADRALATLFILGRTRDPVTSEMLDRALRYALKGDALQKSICLLERVMAGEG